MTATATTTATPKAPTLTPARKGLIRQVRRHKGEQTAAYLSHLPSFEGVTERQIRKWICYLGENPPAKPRQPRKQAASAFEGITQAKSEPADPGTTGEWYSVRAIAAGLGIGVERVYGWMQFGWLKGGPIFTAGDIRAFVRAHPLEIVPRYLGESEWLWLVSVLAGSRDTREGA